MFNPLILMMFNFGKQLIYAAFLLIATFTSSAVENKERSNGKITRNGAFYFSWGYNKEWYTHSDIHVWQPVLQSDYTMHSVEAHDRPGWNENFFHKQLTIPQYNYRLGYFFDEEQLFAIEINFDHTKYVIRDNQPVRVKGKIEGAEVDEQIVFSEAQGFYYFLNNGANFLLINLVRRVPLFATDNNYFRADLLVKAGVGPVIPHVENALYGKSNDAGFQLGGWNIGVETALRVSLLKYAYLEFAQKADYARYSHLKVYNGRARHSFGTYELILSLGASVPLGKNNPLFNSHKKAFVHNDI